MDNLILGRGCQNEEEKERKYERERKTAKLKLKVENKCKRSKYKKVKGCLSTDWRIVEGGKISFRGLLTPTSENKENMSATMTL